MRLAAPPYDAPVVSAAESSLNAVLVDAVMLYCRLMNIECLISDFRSPSLMDLYANGASWLPVDSFYEQTRLMTPDILQSSNLTTFAFLVALAALSSRIMANRKVPGCLVRKLDILVTLKALFGVVYIAAAATILAYAKSDSQWVLPSVGVAAAVNPACVPSIQSQLIHAHPQITFVIASISEHYHSIAPSTLTTLYAVFGAAFYAYTVRGIYEMPALPVGLYATSAVAMSLLRSFSSRERASAACCCRQIPYPPAYESTLSFLVKPFFPHILPLLYIGSKGRIRLPELHNIPLHLKADPATEKLLAALATDDKTSNLYLLKSTFKVFGGQFLSPVLPRLLMLAAIFFSLAISNYVYYEKVNAFMVLYGSALTGSLYAKTLRLTSMAAREVGQGAATTYMSVDVEKVTSRFQLVQDFWAAAVTIAIACTMLWYKAGYVMLAPLLFITTLIASTSTIGSFVGPAQKAWLAAIDIRIKLLCQTSVLGQLLPLKLGTYEASIERKINALRKSETQALKRFMYLIVIAGTLSDIGSSAAFLVTLAAYVAMLANGWGDLAPLDVVHHRQPTRRPLNMIGQTLPQLFASYASLGRIQGFLQLPEKAESEQDVVVYADLVDVSGDDTKVSTVSTVQVSLKKCTFAWERRRRSCTTLLSSYLHANCTWLSDLSPVSDANRSQGKSSLLMSILGETRLVEGILKVKAHKIALASQTPFIYPETLRANILLDSPFDETFYEQVIHACGLRQDIEALPRRDMMKLGDKGAFESKIHGCLALLTCTQEPLFLAGNARDWQAIARAVYARADLILLDDVFSALDGETEAHVFRSLFGPDGMLKGKTTVLVTYAVRHLPSADKVIVMDAGKITHFGSFEEVHDAGATFALASTAVGTDAGKGDSGFEKRI
ncbi:hypothetical protein DFH09DRAFT_1477440 [Mycena vulgaris]|nr:hypothetical protein DFH09DRAFT_1477440 [Mycena vulgaris]